MPSGHAKPDRRPKPDGYAALVIPATQYARIGDLHIAYQTLGDLEALLGSHGFSEAGRVSSQAGYLVLRAVPTAGLRQG
jgi:hypothetical protein